MPVSHRRAPQAARDTTVYTNAPNRRGEARFSHLCTLSRPRGVARDATVYTNAQNWRGEARSSHLCTLLRSQGHSQPKPAAQQCTQTPQSGAWRLLPPICVHCCDPKATHSPTVYTNAPIRRGEARSSHLCTLLWSSRVPTVQQCTQTPQIDAERPNPPICVHFCDPKAPRGCPRSSRRNDSVTGVARAASPGPLPCGDRHRHIIAPEQLPQLLGSWSVTLPRRVYAQLLLP